tara:strand:- start:725 stop:1153 length:429 start_codon:yes stop_codon:yes gene_type:complete
MGGQGANKKYIDDYKKDYEYFTGKASDINRNLALAGVAIIWIFKTTSETGIAIPNQLISPLVWLIVSLGLDLLQYIAGGLIWLIFYRYQEQRIDKKKIKAKKNIKAPPILPGILHFIYWSKLTANIIAYFLLFKFLLQILMK